MATDEPALATDERSRGVLDRVRRFLQAEGGDLEIVGSDGASIRLHQTGRCAGCPSALMALLPSVERALHRASPEMGDIRFTARTGASPEWNSARRYGPAIVEPLPGQTRESGADEMVVGQGGHMRALADFIRIISSSDSTVLLTGESGTGKEVTAMMIHRSSRRRARPFVAVSCALFSDTLIESELFGHERGAFTGATRDRPGRFELAEGGTLFLDDIDDIPLAMQVKLLRVLQSRTIERLGGSRTVPVNVRVIAASKHDLKHMVGERLFREDLFYRLNVIPITLPPLRDRREEIPDLMHHFMERSARRRGEVEPEVPPLVRQAFQQYDWPGNVRELENACERIVQTCFCGSVGSGCLTLEMLPEVVPASVATSAAVLQGERVNADVGPSDLQPIDLDQRLRDVESGLLDWAMSAADGNKARAAVLLKVSRTTFNDRLARRRRHLDAGVDLC